MGDYKKENGTTRVGDLLRSLGDVGKPILKAAGGLTGQAWLTSIADGIKTSSDLKNEQKQMLFDLLELDVNDRADARKMNSNIQDSANASWLAKNTAYMLDIGIFTLIVLIILGLFFIVIPEGNKEILYLIVGTILGFMGATWAFHRGSTQGSKDKTQALLKK